MESSTITSTVTNAIGDVSGKLLPVQVDTPSSQNSVADNGSSFFEEVHFLGDKAGKVTIRSPPRFDNIEDQRKYQKQHLAVAFRVFARQGFDEGVAGHICKSYNITWTSTEADGLRSPPRSPQSRVLLDKSTQHPLLSNPRQ